MTTHIYVGTVGTPKAQGSITGNGEGIYHLVWDGKDDLQVKDVLRCENASMITGDGSFLYCVNETKDFGGMNGTGGGVTACAIQEDGSLRKINDSLSFGSRPAYVSTYGQYILVANHGSHSTVTCHYEKVGGEWKLERGFDDASVALFERNQDGSIGKLKYLDVFDGSGYWCYGGGQSTSHIHCVIAKDDYIVACNRGADEIELMKLDEEGKLKVVSRNKSQPAFAPRHAVFHPYLDILYVLNENYPCISVYRLNREEDALEEIETIGTMHAGYEEIHKIPHYTKRHADKDEMNASAMGDRALAMPSDIHISNDGRFLYASNRYCHGASIVVFRVKEGGVLQKVSVHRFDGKDIRGFQLSKDGCIAVIAELDKNNIEIYALDAESGVLKEKSAQCMVPSPSSIVIS